MTFRHSLDRLIDVCASDAIRKRLQAVSERPPASLHKAKSLADWFASVMAAVDGASAEEGDDSGEGGDSAAMSGMGEDDGGGWTDSQGGARGGDASMVSVGGGGGRPSGASSASSCSLSRRACSPLQTCETWKAKKPRLTAAPTSSGSAGAKRRCCLCPSRINKFSAGHSLLELIELSDGCVAHRICCMYIPEVEGMRARASTVALATQPMRPKVRRKRVASPRLISLSLSSICMRSCD